MSKVSYSLIDDDQIDDQDAINVGNLIIDLESVLEKEKIENEQQANNNNNNSQPACTTTFNNSKSNNSQPSSSTNNETKPTSSTNSKNSANNNKLNSKSQQSLDKQSNNSSSHTTNNSMNNNSNKDIIDGNVATKSSIYKSGGEIKMRIARETKAGKSEHKIVSSPNQKSPTSSSAIIYNNSSNNTVTTLATTATTNLNNNKTIISEDSSSNLLEPTQSSSSISSTKECGTSTSIGTITEPECLGPCEPGTSVTLEGIVWQETEGGILVVNVTWRGKTYVGALLDCTKHDWAPPRLCDSPASDIDSKAHKGVRPKRIVTRSNGIGLDEKNLLQTTGKLRNGKGRRILTTNDLAPCNKRQRESSDKTTNENINPSATSNAIPAQGVKSSTTANVSLITNSDTACVPESIDTTPANSNNEQISTSDIIDNKNSNNNSTTNTNNTKHTGPNSPMLINCNEPNCSKKYRNMNGLLYHQAHAHLNNNYNSSNSKDKIESPTESTESIENQTDKQHTEVNDIPQQDTRIRSETRNDKVFNNNDNIMKQQYINERLHEKQINANELSMETFKSSGSIETNSNTYNPIINNNRQMEQTPTIMRFHETTERRTSNSSSHDIMNNSHGHRKSSPTIDNCNSNSASKHKHHPMPNNNPPTSQQQPPPLNSTTVEEGMKPSGTSTGPPPAPHQANCFFNSPFLAGSPYNPFGINPYLTRPPTLPPPMYDQLAQPTTSNAFLKLMNSMRVPPLPESPSRLLSPSLPKNLPFPPYKVEPGQHVPTATQMSTNPPPPMPNMPPMMNPHLAGGNGSPHQRMPGQLDPMLPHGLPPPPPFAPSILSVPNQANPLSRPPVPNLLDDPMSKQFPRRFN